MVGQTIGHYRLLDKLGEGGMGVVFRAQDMRLGRCVAVKVLPPDKVADPARKARFVQEARAASALNHPNIIQIYDIDQSDGVDFIVMEYVPGRTLDQVMGRKGLSLAGALTYAVQIARALAAAHAAGIVHRDLKPANVMVTNEGVVKLLDFGLAKLTGPAETGEFDSTETQKADTGEGVLLGTVAYMSPEQAEGKEIDARSDIFSFGSLLYEMVTGRRAFQGETRASTLAAVLREEPKPVSHWAPGMPREAERLIRRCLRKNPAHRFQHMDDLKVALEELKEESDSGQLQSEALPPRARRRIGLWIGLAAGLVLAAIAAVKWNRLLTSRPAPEPAFTRLTFDAGLSTDPAVSPDGKLLAYASDRGGGGNLELWVKHLGGGEPIRLTRGAEDILEPRFSPDGATIAFRWERDGGGIYTISSLGGEPRLIAKHGRRPVFSPDGRSIAYWVGENLVGGRIFVVAAHGGEPLAVQSGFHGAICPLWTPDGKGLLFVGIDRPQGRIDWWFTPVQGGTAAATGAVDRMRTDGMRMGNMVFAATAVNFLVPAGWKPDGSAVVFSGLTRGTSNLWEMSFSAGNRQATAIRRLSSGTSFEAQPATAAGAVAFASLTYKLAIWSLPFRPDEIRAAGEMQPLTQGAYQEGIPSMSVDGKRLVFLSNRAGALRIWMKDLNLDRETSLTTTSGYPRISPDGSMVAYRALAGDGNALYTVPASGGLPEKLCENCGGPADFSPDGAGLLLHFTDRTNSKTALLDLRTGARAAAIEHSQSIVAQPHFSPDGRWIAFHSHVGPDRVRLFVVRFGEGSTPQPKDWIPITEGNTIDRDACWSPNGDVLYFHSERDGFRCLWAQRLHPFTKRPVAVPVPVLHLHSRRRGLNSVPISLLSISVARDKIVFPVSEVTGDIWRMEWGETASSPAGR